MTPYRKLLRVMEYEELFSLSDALVLLREPYIQNKTESPLNSFSQYTRKLFSYISASKAGHNESYNKFSCFGNKSLDKQTVWFIRQINDAFFPCAITINIPKKKSTDGCLP